MGLIKIMMTKCKIGSKKELNTGPKDDDEMIKNERVKVYEDIIELCEFHKKKLMNLSIPMRERSMNILNDIIEYCCEHETEKVEEIKLMEDK